MEDHASSKEEKQPVGEREAPEQPPPQPGGDTGSGGDGWGWGFSPLSVLSDLQIAAAVAAEEISRSAAEVAKKAANSIDDLQKEAESPKPSKDNDSESESSYKDGESEDDDDKRKAALEHLENASEDRILGQGLKNLDDSVEKFASEAWRALGNAWRGGSSFINKLEDSIQQSGGSVPLPPSLLETGKAFSAKGMQVLEYVGKETIGVFSETDTKKDKSIKGGNKEEEEVTFDRCFYIYGGPEQLEELEALSNHCALLFNRRKAKLSSEKRSEYDVKLKKVQQIFSLEFISDGNNKESEKGKKVENSDDGIDDEIKKFHDSSVKKAAEMTAGFANSLSGLSPIDILKRTGGRLDSIHSEGVHRLSEMCCIVVSQLVSLGKSVIPNRNELRVADVDILKIEWPEDSTEKAKIIRKKTEIMTRILEDVSIGFSTGLSDVGEAYATAVKGSGGGGEGKVIEEKVDSFCENLRGSRTLAVAKIQDGLHYLAYLVVSDS